MQHLRGTQYTETYKSLPPLPKTQSLGDENNIVILIYIIMDTVKISPSMLNQMIMSGGKPVCLEAIGMLPTQ